MSVRCEQRDDAHVTRKDVWTVVLVTAVAGASGAAALAAASSVSTDPPPAYVSPTQHGAVDTPPAPLELTPDDLEDGHGDVGHGSMDGADEVDDRDDARSREHTDELSRIDPDDGVDDRSGHRDDPADTDDDPRDSSGAGSSGDDDDGSDEADDHDELQDEAKDADRSGSDRDGREPSDDDLAD